MYSSGLPILYPFATAFYMVLYWVYKGLLIKYYARTTKFDKNLPIKSINFVKFGVFIHLVIGCVMFSNQTYFPAKERDEDEDAEAYDFPDDAKG